MSHRFEGQLQRIREDGLSHWIALVACLIIGLVLASLHWIGLVAGGALVGLVAASLRRAIVAGFGFGLVVLLVWATRLAVAGSFGKVTAMGEIALLGVAIALVGAVFGSLARGII